jgi:hypothetical protein
MRHPEEDLQIVVVRWFAVRYGPVAARWLHHSPNGGGRSKAQAGRFKAAGTKAGFPDLIYPRGRGSYVGFALELKTDGNTRVSVEQHAWLGLLADEGWCARVAHGYEQAKLEIERYMALPVRGPVPVLTDELALRRASA